MVSTDCVLNNTNNDTAFSKIRIGFEESFEMKVQEGCFLQYLNFLVFNYLLYFSIDQVDQIRELVNKWFSTGNIRKGDTHF